MANARFFSLGTSGSICTMIEDWRATWIVFAVLVAAVVYGGWLPWSFLFAVAVISVVFLAIKGNG